MRNRISLIANKHKDTHFVWELKTRTMIKKAPCILLLVYTFCSCIMAENFTPYKIKLQGIGGYIHPHDENVEVLVHGPALGSEIALELGTDGSESWHIHHNFPDIGIAAQYLTLSNPEILGEMISLYPYINFPMVVTDWFSFYLKLGGGVALATKPTDIEGAIEANRPIRGANGLNKDFNFVIGSTANVILAGGATMEVRLSRNLRFTSDLIFNHYSNGNTVQPNMGLNLANVYVGLKYIPIYDGYVARGLARVPSTHDRFSGEVIFSGGSRQRYYKDTKNFPTASVNIGGYYHTCHQHRIGIGLDGFYNGIFSNDPALYPRYTKTNITTDELKNKLRLGINLANDVIVGRFTAGLQFGVYLYDPIKDLEPYIDPKDTDQTRKEKGLIYAYDIEKEDGWLYTRLSAKYRIIDHIIANISIKTHLHKAEFIEFGLGYAF